MQLENLVVKKATLDCTRALEEFAREGGHNTADDYFLKQYEAQEKGGRVLFLGWAGDDLAAYGVLNWHPKYAFFLKMGFPEVQDLFVHPDFRRMGVGRSMITHCEDVARERACEYMGIGVGLDASYGVAQQLYVRMGYVPDGNGVTYDRVVVRGGEMRPVDDDLSLMMVKEL